MDQNTEDAVLIAGPERQGPFVLVCEHAVNAFPAPWGTLGLTDDQRAAHIAWDPGAKGLGERMARQLDAPFVTAGVSRLVYDLNRPPNSKGASPTVSETQTIPGNADLSPSDRLARTRALYLPFHNALRGLIAERLALGLPTVLVTIHSFTPVYFGKARSVEFGIINDADPALALAVFDEARTQTSLNVQLNQPYSAADGVTHTLALQATPMGILNVMLELRNDLISDPTAQDIMAERLVKVLRAAVARVTSAKEDA